MAGQKSDSVFSDDVPILKSSLCCDSPPPPPTSTLPGAHQFSWLLRLFSVSIHHPTSSLLCPYFLNLNIQWKRSKADVVGRNGVLSITEVWNDSLNASLSWVVNIIRAQTSIWECSQFDRQDQNSNIKSQSAQYFIRTVSSPHSQPCSMHRAPDCAITEWRNDVHMLEKSKSPS